MFTGIITHIGTVKRIKKSGDWLFTIAADKFTKQLAEGASVCCSGACLTVIDKNKKSFTAQVSKETLARTTLGSWKEGTRLNLERALKLGDELGGHMVTGHVDGLAQLISKIKSGQSYVLTFVVPKTLSHFIAAKGSVTLDGVSLTVNGVKGDHFHVNIIPHTLIATTLVDRKPGDKVNFEIDVIARYLARLKGQ